MLQKFYFKKNLLSSNLFLVSINFKVIDFCLLLKIESATSQKITTL